VRLSIGRWDNAVSESFSPQSRTNEHRRCGCSTTTAREALAYLAAWDVHRGQVNGRCEPSTGIEPFERLVGQVMSSQPLRLGPKGEACRRTTESVTSAAVTASATTTCRT
jgi:hypothetical protein